MQQKIIKVGNSLAITIPKKFIDESGFKAGDSLFVHPDQQTKSLFITPNKNAAQHNYGTDFSSWLAAVENKYAPAIRELAQA